ncbi:MAG: hypothetical protein ACFFCI_00720 [Promethearchaeota archaeon]
MLVLDYIIPVEKKSKSRSGLVARILQWVEKQLEIKNINLEFDAEYLELIELWDLLIGSE